ncbi:hypothetical protein Ae201684P_022363 [Aphanomyces euteiches]|nr:hypothetical protein Ae201684P_022363 [Aphanomyces euteiches]
MDAAYYIKQLEMLPHPEEGGFFSIKHRSSIQVDTPGHLGPPRRAVCSTIHYMVRPLMYIHINAASDISHFWHAGAPIRYFLVNPATYELETLILGPELATSCNSHALLDGGKVQSWLSTITKTTT